MREIVVKKLLKNGYRNIIFPSKIMSRYNNILRLRSFFKKTNESTKSDVFRLDYEPNTSILIDQFISYKKDRKGVVKLNIIKCHHDLSKPVKILHNIYMG